MVTRGAAPSAACPRCGEVVPASTARLVTCASCKLSFDPSAERPVSIRRNRAAAMIERIKVTRTPTSLRLSSSFERRKGLAIAVGGVAIIAGAMLYGLGVFAFIAMTVGTLITLLGLAFISPHVIRVQPELLSAGRLLGRRSELMLTDVDKVQVGAVHGVNEAVAPTYYVAAESGSGPNVLLFITKSQELADHVARVVNDAIATMPPNRIEAAAVSADASMMAGKPIRLPGDVGEPD